MSSIRSQHTVSVSIRLPLGVEVLHSKEHGLLTLTAYDAKSLDRAARRLNVIKGRLSSELMMAQDKINVVEPKEARKSDGLLGVS